MRPYAERLANARNLAEQGKPLRARWALGPFPGRRDRNDILVTGHFQAAQNALGRRNITSYFYHRTLEEIHAFAGAITQ